MFNIGITICDDQLAISIVNATDGQIAFEATGRISDHSGNIAQSISAFLTKSIQKCTFDRNDQVQIAVAVDQLFSYEDSFENDVRKSLTDIRDGPSVVSVQVIGLEALAFTGIFKGIILKADRGVSIADKTVSGKSISINERGHMIGDPGSAYWISNKCFRMIYDNMDGLEITNYDLRAATKAANEYFRLNKPLDILKPLYSDFSKEQMTGFFGPLAKLASNGDKFCVYLFHDAGRKLGHLLKALVTQAMKENDTIIGVNDGKLSLLGIGRVWNHYELIREGILEIMNDPASTNVMQSIRQMVIYQLDTTESCAVALSIGQPPDKVVAEFKSNLRALATELITR